MIHKTAIVDKKAEILDNVEIGPYCIIGPEVEIGNDSVLHSHVNIVGNTKIGENNQIYPFSSIGTPPQDLKYKGIAYVGDKKMADAQWSATIVDRK